LFSQENHRDGQSLRSREEKKAARPKFYDKYLGTYTSINNRTKWYGKVYVRTMRHSLKVLNTKTERKCPRRGPHVEKEAERLCLAR
jgi:hypothetical protein